MAFNHWDDSASITDLGRAGSGRQTEHRGLDASRSAMMLRLLRQVPQEALAQDRGISPKKRGKSYLKNGSELPPPFLRENVYYQSLILHNWVEIGEDEDFSDGLKPSSMEPQ